MCREYTDALLVSELCRAFGVLGYTYYLNFLKDSCNIYSSSFYGKYYLAMEAMLGDISKKCFYEEFMQLLAECDRNVGIDNNLGEIKIYTMAQIFQRIGLGNGYVFCSDDRKARYGIATNTPMNCVSTIAAFVILKNRLGMKKEEAKIYFDSWMQLHKQQREFKIYNNLPGKQLIKVEGYQIFEKIYSNQLGIWKDGYLRIK